jgi:hypothetical protein
MDTQYITIDAGAGDVLASNVSRTQPQIRGILGTELNLAVAFSRGGVVAALPVDASGKLVLKKLGDPSGPVIAEDAAWTVTSGRYHFSIDLVSESLHTLLGSEPMIKMAATVDWVEDDTGLDLPHKSFDFVIDVYNSSSRLSDDPAPPPARTGIWFDHYIKLLPISGSQPNIALNNPIQRPFAFARAGTLYEMDLIFYGREPVTVADVEKWGFTVNWRWTDGNGNLTTLNTRTHLDESEASAALTQLECKVVPLMTTPLTLLQGSALFELMTVQRTSFSSTLCSWAEVALRLRGRYDS